MAEAHSFVHLMFIGIIALFPVVNPIGTAFIVMPYFQGLSHDERKRAVRKVAAYALGICTVALIAGHWIMELFGISIPVVQTAGGIMICKFGWEFLSEKDEQPAEAAVPTPLMGSYSRVESKLFYPVTFPITTGAGTLSVIFTLSAHDARAPAGITRYLLHTASIQLAVVVMCVLIYVFYLNAEALVRILGVEGQRIFNRVIAFLIFCVGIQIASSGLKSLFIPGHVEQREVAAASPSL